MMERDNFYADINKEAKVRRLKWGHISNYPAALIEQLLQDKTMTVEERNELIQWQIGSDPDPSTWMPVLLADLRRENEQLCALLLAAREIVKELAESNSYAYSDNTGLMECVFCNDSYGWPPFDKETKDHEPDCLISKAQALIKEHSS